MFPIIDLSGPGVSKEEFVNFWIKHYDWNRKGYKENIGKELTEKRAIELFLWKDRFAARRIDQIKQDFLNSNHPIPNSASDTVGLEKYFSKYPKSTVYPVFWLHCNHPSEFPIIDQHAYRAMIFIKTGKKFNKFYNYEPAQRKFQQSYIYDYIPFIDNFGKIPIREVDMALMAFGQFLKKYQLS